MRNFFTILLLFAATLYGDVKYVDIFDAYDEAEVTNKKVMIMVSQIGCRACDYMEDIVFKDKRVIEALNSGFIVVHIDKHKQSVPNGLEYFATPTFFFLNSDEKLLKRVTGAEHPKEFLETLQSIK